MRHHRCTARRCGSTCPGRSRRAQFLDLDIGWRFTVPDYGAGRMGRDGTLYEIGQWYPRMAVYDDVRGWNHEPYIGGGEFYLEYGGFDVALTVPADYIVGATGVLRNPAEVLTADPARRLARARTSAEPVAIITAEEAGRRRRGTRPVRSGTRHLALHAPTACATSPSAPRPTSAGTPAAIATTLVHTLYRPSAPEWEEANRMVRDAVQYYSEQWYPYPYPHITSIEGPIEGMEYPMITFDPRAPSREERQWVLAHELGHQWVPMIVGSNERLYPWMDEGFNTFIDLGNAARYFKGTPYGDSIEVHPLHLYPDHAIRGPGAAADQPPGRGARPLLDRLPEAGADDADAALRGARARSGSTTPSASTSGPGRSSTRRRPISSGSCATRRGWIWTASGATGSTPPRGWTRRWTRWARPRASRRSSSRTAARMTLPLEMDLTYDDGTTERVRLPVEMWNLGPRFAYRVADGERQVTRVVVDPRRRAARRRPTQQPATLSADRACRPAPAAPAAGR